MQWPFLVVAQTASAGHTARKLGAGAGVRTSAPRPEHRPRRRVPADSQTKCQVKPPQGHGGWVLKPGNRVACCGRSLVLVPTHTRVLHNKHHASDVLGKTPTKVHAVALFGCSADCLGRAHRPRSVVQSVHGHGEPTGLPCHPIPHPRCLAECPTFPDAASHRMHRTSGH